MPKPATPKKKPAPKKPAAKKSAKPAAPKTAAKPAAPKTAAPKKGPAFGRAMKLVESGASGFKIVGYTRSLEPADAVLVYEALAARPSPPSEAPDLLAGAYARAGRFADAVRTAKKGNYPGTLHDVGEAALDAGALAEAEAAFAAIEAPKAVALIGLALAQKKAGKDFTAALARAEEANVAKKPIDWTSATSCYEHVGVAIAKAMILAVGGDVGAAKRSLAEARKGFAAVAQKGVREECDDQLAAPADPQWWASPIARHAGL